MASPAGPRCRALLRSLERRLVRSALVRSCLLASAFLFLCLELAAAVLTWAPAPVQGGVGPALAVAAASAALLAVWPLVRRPSRRYLAGLCERSCPAFEGQLMLLAEGGAGCDAGVLELAAERAETAAASASARAAARLEGRSVRPWLAAAAMLVPGAALSLFCSGGLLTPVTRSTPGAGQRHGAGEQGVVAVAPAPSLELVGVVYSYPDYTGLEPLTADGAGGIDCLQSARAELRLRSRGRVDGVDLQIDPGGGTVGAARGPDGLWTAGFTVRQVGFCTVRLRSAGAAAEALRLPVTARRDLPPTVSVSIRELADDRLALDYRAEDDYRLGGASMVFTVAGRGSRFSVPEASGRRETHGTVLVPREVLALAGSAGFSYRIEAEDTRAPEPNRAVGDDLEYRPPQRLAAAGPLLERRPPPAAPPGGQTAPPAGGGPPGESVRPLETLRKETEDEKPPPPDNSQAAGQQQQSPEFLAPPGEEVPGGENGQRRPPKRTGQEGQPGGEPGQGESDGGDDGGAAPVPDDEPVNTPGGNGRGGGPSGEAPVPSGNPGGGAPAERPPNGHETGSRAPLPERVIPEDIRMELKPGETPSGQYGRPAPGRTDWGVDVPREGSGSAATAVQLPASAPPGRLVPPAPGRPDGAVEPGISGPLPVAEPYRRYVNEYLRALAAGEK